MRTKVIFVAMLLASAPLPSVAQDFDAGEAAYKSGDYATALREWKPLAEQGDTRAQSLVGTMYLEGKGVSQDFVEGVRWVQLGAEQGDAYVQLQLGLMYVSGNGVAQNFVLARMWIDIAAANGALGASDFSEMMNAAMPASDISEAQRRALVCMASNYQDCE